MQDESQATNGVSATQQSWASERGASQLESQTQTQAPQGTQSQSQLPPLVLDEARYRQFESRLSTLIGTSLFANDSCPNADLLPEVNRTLSAVEMFTQREMNAALDRMTEENKIFVDDGVCYKV